MQYARALLDGSVADQCEERPSAEEVAGARNSETDDGQRSSQRAEGTLLRLPEKRVSNRKMKQELGVVLRFPTYREGLRAIQSGDQTPFD